MTFQEIIQSLNHYWAAKGCVLHESYDLEKGAGTFHPATFLRSLGPEPYKAAYMEPCRRPTDGRYGKNPNRTQKYFQYQVILKPSPKNIQQLFLASLLHLGLDLKKHDLRFVHDDWKSPTLGAWGLGWEIWINGMEISQFTYFQQMGGQALNPITGEITYGLERVAMYIQDVDTINAIRYNDELTYEEVFLASEEDFSTYNFQLIDPQKYIQLFHFYEGECELLLKEKSTLPAYEFVLKCSHVFNLLDARGVISITEREHYIARIQKLSRKVATLYLISREELQHPLLKKSKKS